MTVLRPYQIEIIEKVFATVGAGKRRIILVAPTGSGKTVIAAEIIKRSSEGVLVLAHRREIVAQTSDKLFDLDIDHGIIQAGFAAQPEQRVQVASVQTLHSRAMRGSSIELPKAGLLVVDECHHATAATWQAIIAKYPDAIVLGLTATPCRGDGCGLGGIFDALVECPQVEQLIEQKFLVGTKVFAPSTPDLAEVATRAGDYVENQLADRMDKPQLVGDIITHWHRLAQNRKTVVFATSVAHSIHICDEFIKSGVACEHIDGSTAKDERDAILRRLRDGTTTIVSNCMVLTEGWDMPTVGCCVLARPTKKMGLYRQMIGRVLRPAEDKRDAIVIDHSGAVFRHGFPEDWVVWTLEPDAKATVPVHAKRGAFDHSRLVECTQCGALRVGGEACRHCGFKPTRPPQLVPYIDGDLDFIARNGSRPLTSYTPEARYRWHAGLTFIAQQRRYKSGWIAHQYRQKFGDWPPKTSPIAIEPSPEISELGALAPDRVCQIAREGGGTWLRPGLKPRLCGA